MRTNEVSHARPVKVWRREVPGSGADDPRQFSAETLEGTTGLAVIGLAFAVGYAVDLFFNLLDAIKIGLGGSSKANTQMREPSPGNPE